jgi:two-component system CheB/CheR fusion protein
LSGEKDGPPVKQPEASGLGSALIDHGIPGAAVNREFQADGFVCTIELSLRATGHESIGETIAPT